jgi:hypothetical protein
MGESNSKCCCGKRNIDSTITSIILFGPQKKKDVIENDEDKKTNFFTNNNFQFTEQINENKNYFKNEKKEEIKTNNNEYNFEIIDYENSNFDTNIIILDKKNENILNSGFKNFETVVNENFTSYIRRSDFDCNILKHSINENNKLNNNITRKKSNINNENYLKFISLDFDKNMIKKINEIRKNPQLFINKIEELKENIIKINNKFYYIKDNIKFLINKGKENFNEIIEYLKKINNLNALEFDQNLLIDVPKNLNELNDKNYLKIKIGELYEKGMKIKYYWKSNIYIESQEENLLMNFLTEKNDTKNKLEAIFDEKIKKIGIKSFQIENKSFYYIILSYG